MNTVAIIPARGGSKRIPRKNIRSFRGKPMIAWSIQAAQASGLFDAIVVSTDDAEIAELAKSYGAEVPFFRPAELADDYASTLSVLRHAVDAYESLRAVKVDYGCCLYATAPFVLPEYLKEGFDRLASESDLDFVFSVTSFPFPIQRALILNERNLVEMLQPEHENTRSQDLPECYHDAGQFYWFRPVSLVQQDGIFSANSAPIVLPRERVQDIDTPEDWRCAELIHRILEERENADQPE